MRFVQNPKKGDEKARGPVGVVMRPTTLAPHCTVWSRRYPSLQDISISLRSKKVGLRFATCASDTLYYALVTATRGCHGSRDELGVRRIIHLALWNFLRL